MLREFAVLVLFLMIATAPVVTQMGEPSLVSEEEVREMFIRFDSDQNDILTHLELTEGIHKELG